MSITRAPLKAEQPYTVFSNELLNDDTLSADALGVLVYLLSKPPNWKVLPGPLGKRFGCGRDKIYRIMNELIISGYASRFQTRLLDGSFDTHNYMVSNEKNPLPENTEEGEPLPDNPHQQKKDTQKLKTDSPYSEEFETEVWKPYPRKLNASKKKAWDLWRMLSDENRARVKRAIPLYAKAMRQEGRPESKIKHLQFWITDKYYETVDEPTAEQKDRPLSDNWWKTATREQWQKVLNIWAMTNSWNPQHGPSPDHPGCAVPADMVAAHNVKHRGFMFSPEELADFREKSKPTVDTSAAA